jgi:hypothetical protein
VSEGSGEIILTGAAVKTLTPQAIRAMWGAQFGDEAKKNFCGVGFRGIRVRGGAKSNGTFVPFDCSNRGVP